MRRETERPEGLEAGTLRLIGAGYDEIVVETRRLLDDPVAYARWPEPRIRMATAGQPSASLPACCTSSGAARFPTSSGC